MPKKLTKSSLSSFLTKKFPTTIKSSSTKIKKGNVVINKPLTVSNKTINGNLVIGDGVGTGEVTLDNVNVTGKDTAHFTAQKSSQALSDICHPKPGSILFSP